MTADQRFWLKLILAISGILIASHLFYSLRLVLVPFFVGFIGAYAFKNFVKRLEKLKLDRTLASAVVVLTLVILLVGLSFIAIPYIQQQLVKLMDAIPKVAWGLLNSLTPLLERFFQQNPVDLKALETQLQAHIGDLLRLTLQFFSNLISSSSVIANLLSWLILSPLVMFYFLKDWPKIFAKLGELIPLRFQKSLYTTLKEIDQMLSAYASGQLLVCFILAILYAGGLKLSGLEQGVVIGSVTGVLSFIPYIGALIGFLASLGLALAQTGDFSLLPSILFVFVIINFIEGYLLTPRLIGQKIGLHPLWILFALLASATWLGFAGLVLTLPLAALMGVLVRLGVRLYKDSPSFKGIPHGRSARS